MNYKFGILLFIVTAVTFSSCKKDKTVIPNEEEVITTLNYTLTPVGGGTAVTMTFRDVDGDGGNDPVITGGVLAANTTYTGAMELLNETESPAEDITEEIEEEDADHQFFYSTTVNGLSVSYTDQDDDGNPVGLKTEVSTTGTGTGEMTVILRHEPNKSGAGVSSGNIANAGGETDIEVTFDVDVQ